MAAVRILRLKPFTSSLGFYSRPSVVFASRHTNYSDSSDEQRLAPNIFRAMASTSYFQQSIGYEVYNIHSNRLVGFFGFGQGVSIAGINYMHNHRFFSSASESKNSVAQGINSISSSNLSNGGGNWTEKVGQIWESTVETLSGRNLGETLNHVVLYIHQWLESYPYLRNVIVPVGGTLTATILAWSLLPRIFKRFHRYSAQGTEALLSGSSFWSHVPYEKSFWSALEDPVRYFITFMAFFQIGEMVAPTVIPSQYVAQAWRGGLVTALVWFLNRWKAYAVSRALSAKSIERGHRDKLFALDKISSVGLFAVGSLAFAEACGVAVHSILTVGGIGGVATAFAAKDILGNLLSGLSVQISQPFSVGDTIRAGSVEGQVVDMGLTTTSLLTAEKFPVTVPNSLFSSQVIVNKSRAKWRFVTKKIPIRVDDVDKIPRISDNIKAMLASNPNVFLEKEPPYCFLSHIERSFAELTLGCNLKQMNKEAEQDILLQAVGIIRSHGGELGSTGESTPTF